MSFRPQLVREGATGLSLLVDKKYSSDKSFAVEKYIFSCLLTNDESFSISEAFATYTAEW